MATNLAARSLLFRPSPHSIFSSLLSRSFSSSSAVVSRPAASLFRSLRPLAAAAAASRFGSSAFVARCLSTRATTSSLNDPSPNWSNRPPKETILLDGCDFEHWLVVMEKPEGDPTRDEIIDSYVKTLAMVVGSEDEARLKMYSVSTRHYFAFGALVSEELSFKLKELPRVRWVLPDSYLDVRNKDYGGEPVIDGVPVPYDPKYHEEWVRNNARANERNRRNDRPRNFDRSRNYDRRRENTQNQNPRGPPMNNQGMPNAQPNTAGPPQNYQGGAPPRHPQQNSYGPPPQQNNFNRPPPQQNSYGPPPQQNSYGPPPQQNSYSGPPPQQNSYSGPPPQQNSYSGPPPQQNSYSGPPPQQNSYSGPPPQQAHFGNHPPQNNMGGNFQNVPHQGAPSNYQNEFGEGRQPY